MSNENNIQVYQNGRVKDKESKDSQCQQRLEYSS